MGPPADTAFPGWQLPLERSICLAAVPPPHLFSHLLALNIMWMAWSLSPAPLGGAPRAPAPPPALVGAAAAAAAAAAADAADAERYSSMARPVTVPLRSGKRQSSAGIWVGGRGHVRRGVRE